MSVLAVGDVNTDIVMAGLPHMPLSEQDVLAERMELLVGGQISTFARASARLGLQVQVVARVGDDFFGEQARSRLAMDGVDTTTMVVDPDHATGATVVLSSGRERAFATYAGALHHVRREDVPAALLAGNAHMHLGSYYYHRDLRPTMESLFLEAKTMGLTTSMDPGWDPENRWEADILDVLPHVDVFIPNKAEAMRISQQDSPSAAVEWLGRYSRTVVAKMGSEGCLLWHAGCCRHIAPFKVPVIDVTSAGDVFNAGYVFALMSGRDAGDCARFANACGAIAVTRVGSEGIVRDLAEVEEFLARHPAS